MTERYQDRSDPLNSARYHTGKPCIEKGCSEPAGTAWSPLWCFRHNVERMDRISGFLTSELARYGGEPM